MKRRLLALVVLAVVAMSCDEGATVTPPPTTPGPLIPGTWYLHAVDDTLLPAPVAARTVGISQEKTLVDSATLVLRADDTYEQRYWTRVLINGTLDRKEVVIDMGTIAPEGLVYRLTSSLRDREFTLTVSLLGIVTTEEQMVYFASSPPVVTGTYKATHP